MNLSRFFENQLKSYFKFIEDRQQQFTPYKRVNDKVTNTDHLEGKHNNQDIHSKDDSGAYGLVVMTSPSHGGGLRFKSG